MKQASILIAFVSVVFSSCQKIIDLIKDHPANQPSTCRVVEIDFQNNNRIDTSTIEYDAGGYPIKVHYYYHQLDISSDYGFERVFTYDGQHRLISDTADDYYFSERRYYVYEGDSKVPVRDSFPGAFGDQYVEMFEYDAQNRIVSILKRTTRLPEGAPASDFPDKMWKYFYDERGNRQQDPSNEDYPGIIDYNDRRSLLSLHPVWKLIHRDYSNNGVDFNGSYNNEGLPTIVSTPYFQPFLNVERGSVISYECN